MKTSLHWGTISPYFTPEEVLSPDTIHLPHLVDSNALHLLNDLRRYLDKPVIVNFGRHLRRGVRSAREQLGLIGQGGGASHSMHVQGKAFDVSVNGLPLHELEDACIGVGFSFVLPYLDAGFIHCDCRTLYEL